MLGDDQTSQTHDSRKVTHMVNDGSSERASDDGTDTDCLLDDLEERIDFLESLIQIMVYRQQATIRWVESQTIEARVASTLSSSACVSGE